jgi:hypothetical protein
VSAGWFVESVAFSWAIKAPHSKIMVSSSFFIVVSPYFQWMGRRRLSRSYLKNAGVQETCRGSLTTENTGGTEVIEG